MWVFLLSSLFVVSCLMLLLLARHCYSYCYSLFDVIAPFATCSMLNTTTLCLTLLLLLLHLSQRCCSFYYSLLNIVVPFVFLCLMVLPLAWHYYSSCYSSCYSFCCSLFNVVTPFATPCLTLLFLYFPLFDIVAPLTIVWSTLLPLLLLLHQRSFIDVHPRHGLFKYPSTMLRCCCSYVRYSWHYSYLSCFRLVFPRLIFCKCGRNSPNSNFQAKLKRWDIFFNICLLMNFFMIHVVFGKFWLTMCLFVMCKNYLDIICLIIHIAFHLLNCIVYFFSTLHFNFSFTYL